MLATIAGYAGSVTCILALLALLCKPVRERFFGLKAIREGQQSLLRSEIVRVYYRNLDAQELREYEYKNLCCCFNAYKSLGGNSFVEHIFNEMQEWKIVQ